MKNAALSSLLLSLLMANPAVAGDTDEAVAADAAESAAADSFDAAAVTLDELGSQRGAVDIGKIIIIRQQNNASVENTTMTGNFNSGDNIISDGAFAEMNGIVTAIQNTGSNVAISSTNATYIDIHQ